MAVVKNQNTGTTFDSETQGYTHTLTNVAYGLGFQITREERDDNQYSIVGKRRSRALAFSFRQTKETVGANIYNRAFTAAYTGGDGSVLCCTTHATSTGSQSNHLTTAADMSEVAVEDLLIQIMLATNSKGLKINLQPQSLVVPPNLAFEACRMYESDKQYDTANNATNAMRKKGVFPKGVKVNNYLTDTDAWFIRTNCPAGLVFLQRVPIEFKQDNDFDTDNNKFKGYERYIPGWGDWRSLYASPGA